MSSIKDLRQRMSNVGTTKQILNAMNMVSATKLNRARARLEGVRPLYRGMKDVAGDLRRFEEVRGHSFATGREVKNTAYVVITSDKGLCGSYNINICEKALEHMDAGKNEKILTIGSKAYQYFKRHGKNVVRRVSDASEAQIYQGAERLGGLFATLYASGEVDEVFIAYTHFESALSHLPRVERLLPLYGRSNSTRQKTGVAHYEPDPVSFFEHMMPLYLHMCFFSALSESVACEHAARMVNMETAGENAADIIDELKQIYNRKRQAAITQELNEIVGSANILQ